MKKCRECKKVLQARTVCGTCGQTKPRAVTGYAEDGVLYAIEGRTRDGKGWCVVGIYEEQGEARAELEYSQHHRLFLRRNYRVVPYVRQEPANKDG